MEKNWGDTPSATLKETCSKTMGNVINRKSMILTLNMGFFTLASCFIRIFTNALHFTLYQSEFILRTRRVIYIYRNLKQTQNI